MKAPSGVKVKVRMEGPYDADVPLQVVCYFKYTDRTGQADDRGGRRAGQAARRRDRLAPRARRVRRRRAGDAPAHPAKDRSRRRRCSCWSASGTRTLVADTMERVGRAARGRRPGSASSGWPSPRCFATRATPSWPWRRGDGRRPGDAAGATTRRSGCRKKAGKGLSPWKNGSSRRGLPSSTTPWRGWRGGSPRRRRSPPSGSPPLTPGRDSRPVWVGGDALAAGVANGEG